MDTMYLRCTVDGCRCLEFDHDATTLKPRSNNNTKICACCEHHRSYHQRTTPNVLRSKLDTLESLADSEGEQLLTSLNTKRNKFVNLMDSYAVETREPNFIGAVLSLCILPATIIYAVMLYLQLQDNPFVESNQIIWSMAFNPFPVDFECLAESGCILSGTEQNGTRHAGCVTMASHERKTFYLNYAGGQMPMISLYTLNGSAEVAVVWSQANHWEGDPPINKNGVKDMAAKLFGATLSANYVKVFNRTLAGVGSVRHEWFFTYMSSDGTHEPFDSDPCVDVVNARGGVAQMQHTKVRMAPFYNEIEVKDSFGVLEYIGTTSGMYGLFLSGGALLLAVMELDYCTRKLARLVVATNDKRTRMSESWSEKHSGQRETPPRMCDNAMLPE
mmetsp:Transcript_35304/g.59505  ORF Transcript_35304/g.59505 Transcript_35304/m.59505 type:complete len:388 (+) Transcript_35304:140-1303(+)